MPSINKLSLLPLLASLVLMLTACEEKDSPTLSSTADTNSTAFEPGKYQNVVVDSGNGNAALYAFNQAKLNDEVLLDANKDGVNDLKIDYEFYRSVSGGQRVTVELTCLNAFVEVVTTNYNDSLKLCYVNNPSYDSVYFNSLSRYNCTGTNSKNLNSISYTSPTVFNVGSQPNNQMNWQNGTFLIKKVDKSAELFARLIYHTEQGPWVRADSKYRLFRINNNGNLRYGWLKLSDKNLWLFAVEEMAFEKE